MSRTKIIPISGYKLTLVPPTTQQPSPFGWINLKNGARDAGFIYLDPTPIEPKLNSTGQYIITTMPFSEMGNLLTMLRGEQDLQIRFFDPEIEGVVPSVFIEPADGPVLQEQPALDIMAEIGLLQPEFALPH